MTTSCPTQSHARALPAPLVAFATAVLLTLPPAPAIAAPAAPAAFVSYQGRVGAFAGPYTTIYGSYTRDIVDPYFLTKVAAGNIVFTEQTVPSTSNLPVGSSITRSVHPSALSTIPIDAANTFIVQSEMASSFTVSAFPGSIHSLVSVGGSINPTTLTYVDPTGVTLFPNDFTAGNGVASAVVALHDFITVGSSDPSLHVGDPVTVRLTGTLHSIVIDTQAASSPSAINFSYVLGIFGLGNDFLSLRDGDGTIEPHLTPAQRTQFVDVQLHVGDTVEFLQALNSQTSAVVNGANPAILNQADASNTALARLDILTPGATLSSSSGFDYTAIPEPASLALTLLPLTLLSTSRRRPIR
jgi:hypothetical protein